MGVYVYDCGELCNFKLSSNSALFIFRKEEEELNCNMAPGEGRVPKTPEGEGAAAESASNEQKRPTYFRANSVEEAMGQTPAIINAIFGECFRADGLAVPADIIDSDQRSINKEVAHAIRDIGDRLSNEASLNHMISQVVVSKDTAFDTFLQVAENIFTDGIVNWGRIVTLFYFGYKLAVQVIFEVPLIKMIIEWVCKFVKDQLVDWIFKQGGWVSVMLSPYSIN